ncbi:MAG: DUF1800 family protein, partial [Ectothiorhodospiraceae bacterium]|nr:DUF1800 family protein [Ectothiorhodospiraceae bacterium]
YDTLTRHALGNYQDLMWAVTLSPAMGLYLSMLKNEKADPETNLRPDENYAREVMQLFSIGLVELNPDGSVKRDAQGEPIPTYSQSDVEELARIFTGWNFNGATNWKWPQKNYLPMQPWYAYHDFDAKVIVGNTAIPAGLTPDDDMGWAIHTLFHHPNTAPFVAFRLIQRLVTSNPSPAYVQRVAAVFADNGAGVRGDLYAVAKAILLDPEARFGHVDQPQTFGKLKEPLLRQAALWRAFDARSVDGAFREWRPETEFGQAALRSPSVFNFYQPDHKPAGALGDLGLYGPEFQITTHAMITRTTNRMYERTFRSYPGFANANERTVTLNLAAELALASDPAALVDRIALLLTADGLSSASRDLIIQHVNGVSMTAGNLESGMQRVLEAIYLIATSPEGAVQR